MRFETTLFLVGNNTGIDVPPAVLEELGGGKRPAGERHGERQLLLPERRRADGRPVPHRLQLRQARGDRAEGRRGDHGRAHPRHRAAHGRGPDDLAAALAEAGLRDAFDKLAPSHQKAHVTSVEGAKAAETRARRVAAVVDKLS